MSQIRKKFIANNAIDESKIRLGNNGFVRARNAAGDADVNLFKLNASDLIELGQLPLGPNSNAPTTDAQLANKKYIDDQVAAVASGAEWQESCQTQELDSASLTPSSGDRNLINGTGAGDFLAHDNEIAIYNGSSWDFIVPKIGTFVSVDSNTSGIYYFGGSTWAFKSFEATTASTGLTKVGFDVRVDASLAGDGLAFNAGVMSVNVDDSTIELNIDSLRVKDSGITADKIANAAVGAAKLGADVAGDGIVQDVDGSLDVNVDGSTLEINADVVRVKDLGISTAKLANDSVDKTKINEDIAGNGLSQAVGGELDVNVDGTTLEIDTDALRVKDGGISAAKLNANVAGSGVSLNITTNAVDVNVDDTTIEINSDALRVKAGGISEAQLNSSVDAESFVLASGYAPSAGTVAASDSIQAAIAKLDGNIAGISFPENKKADFTLDATDISNGYVDLAHVAKSGSIILSVVGGGLQNEGASYDFTVNYTGGAGGNTRITFVNGLASAGVSALESGDIVIVKYSHI